ncbi:DUF4926 domain-containing protein [Rahnella perminowiae]|uniref:DUF4926 domain-containing protein n=1 Tax=Rahnella TaxID=34037 RepID=UPI0010220BBA|nr:MULTISPECIES: DUF4926 domain-containing protein [Rahnella]MCR9003592.1 DUF4926 domain-containing protein [Rahnella perminowiae]
MIPSPYDVVVLVKNMPDKGLTKGMIGTVVDVYSTPSLAYEVEFCDQQGRTIVSLALAPERLQYKP